MFYVWIRNEDLVNRRFKKMLDDPAVFMGFAQVAACLYSIAV